MNKFRLVAIAAMLATAQVHAHGDVTPQAVDVTKLKKLDGEQVQNPYRGDEHAIQVGSSAYSQNCARCHGLGAVSGGIAPDLRTLPLGDEADEYFASRARGSRIASATSRQSRPLSNRQQMMDEVAELTAMVGEGDMPRPTHWSGFRLVPTAIEFWKDGEFRLHDRVRFTRDGADGAWSSTRLYP